MVTDLPASDRVVSLPGAAAATLVWRTQGQLYVTVIVKATFAFAPSSEMPWTDPQEILAVEVHHSKNPARSVRFTSDRIPYLGRVDVLFTGHAHAPPQRSARELPVRLAIFEGQRAVLDKKLLVQDDEAFERMPIVYERALSGADGQENPLGVAEAAGEGKPNITDPAAPRRPAGFGPIARAWPARKRLLGATPRKALEGAVVEIPEGFDWSYFQAAPPDQQLRALRGDEWIVLEGLHPTLPSLRTRLPGARGRARVYGLSAFGVSEGQPLELAADTLRIDGDEQRCSLVWRQSFPIAGEAALAAVQVVAGVELPRAPIVWPDPPARRPAVSLPEETFAEAPSPATPIETLAIPPSPREPATRAAALPFQPAPPSPPPAAALPSRPPSEPVFTGTFALSPDEEEAAAARPAVPFPGIPNAPAPRREAAPPIFTPPILAPAIFASPPPGAPLGSFDASNAAAAASSGSPSALETTGLPPLASEIAKELAPSHPEPGDLLDLLWFDPKSLPRVRKQPAFRPILDALNDMPLDPDIDDPALEVEPAAAEERREIFEVLARGEALGDEALKGALRGAIRGDGRFVAPLVLLEGELALPFDEIEALKAIVATVTPLVGSDDRLKAALSAAREFLQTLDPLSSSALAEGLTAALKEAYGRGKHALPLAKVEAQAERALLEHRRYQRRAVFGGRQLRCLLQPTAAASAIPAYLPEALAEALPMFERFRARLLAEAHLAADQREAHPVALRVLAIARAASPAHRW